MNFVNNKCITIVEAYDILCKIRKIDKYKHVFDNVSLMIDNGYAFNITEETIYIDEEFKISASLDVINDKYNVEINGAKLASIQAFLHECGHAIDYYNHKQNDKEMEYFFSVMAENMNFDSLTDKYEADELAVIYREQTREKTADEYSIKLMKELKFI